MKKPGLLIGLMLLVFLAWGLGIKRTEPRPKTGSRQETLAAKIKLPESPSLGPLDLNRIFQEDHSWTATLPAERKRTLIITGDVMLGRTVNRLVIQKQNFSWPWEKVAPFLQSADLTLVNLESPLLAACPVISGGFKFCGDARQAEGLAAAGIDIAGLSNNHAGNFGEAGIKETAEVLAAKDILTVRDNKPTFRKINNLLFTFLAYDDTIASVSAERVREGIAAARPDAGVVIILFHWGREYTDQPDSRQIKLAHLAIDAGADLVAGSHPHWIQSLEVYRGKLIVYSLGNFIFDQEWSLPTKQGIAGRFTFYQQQLADAQFYPLIIENYGQPRFLQGGERRVILDSLASKSAKLAEDMNTFDKP